MWRRGGLGLCVLGVHMHAELEITHRDSPCLFPGTFSFGEASCFPPAPSTGIALWEKRMKREFPPSGRGNPGVRLQRELPQLLFASPEARMHAPRLQTVLMLKVHMPWPVWAPFGASALMAFGTVSWIFFSEVAWLPQNWRSSKSTFLDLLIPGNSSKSWTL